MVRPIPWKGLRPLNTLWVDYKTGRGVMSNGQTVTPRIGGRRKTPNLTDILETAASHQAERIMFTGAVPTPQPGKRHWLLVQTPGWQARGHWLGTPVTGRFERTQTGQWIEVRTASEWFGDTNLKPAEARIAWDATAAILNELAEAPMALTPAATGTNLWAKSLPYGLDLPEIDQDILDELHATSGQHHIEHLVAGPARIEHPDCVPMIDPAQRPQITHFSYIDGRFMYGALCRELGIGEAIRYNRADTFDLLENDRYARARVLLKFTVPHNWNHVGLFGVQHKRTDQGWYYPNRPGATGTTWADAAEVHVARLNGWQIEPLESVYFHTKVMKKGKLVAARPLDTFADRIKRAREWVEGDPEMPPVIKKAVSAAFRAILIQTIGSLASRGRGRTEVTDNPTEIPAELQHTIKRQGNFFTYRVPTKLTEKQKAYYHPYLAAQVWGRGRARVLSAPMANGVTGGALSVPGNDLIGINGDAIYVAGNAPAWALPEEEGGADDGKIGRLRFQGFLSGNMKTPNTLELRDRYRARAVKEGFETAANYTEFLTPQDDVDYAAGGEDDEF